jgi:hypothetical protein
VGFWGSEGAGDGEFDRPAGIAVASDGAVYVADGGNDRIQLFSYSGSFLGKWGEPGIGDSDFNGASDVAIAPKGDVYVVDGGMLRLKYFSSKGDYKGGWGKASRLNTWVSIDVGPNGDVYIVDFGAYADLVRRFSREGAPLGEWHSGAVAVAVAPNGNVYDADPLEAIAYYTYTGAFLGRWNSGSDEVYDLERPYEIAIGPDGTVFVADYIWEGKYSRVKFFTLTGEFLGELPLEGFTGLNAIGGLAVGPDGTVYVTDTNNHRVHYFRRVVDSNTNH